MSRQITTPERLGLFILWPFLIIIGAVMLLAAWPLLLFSPIEIEDEK